MLLKLVRNWAERIGKCKLNNTTTLLKLMVSNGSANMNIQFAGFGAVGVAREYVRKINIRRRGSQISTRHGQAGSEVTES